jgi:hypothetical protein
VDEIPGENVRERSGFLDRFSGFRAQNGLPAIAGSRAAAGSSSRAQNGLFRMEKGAAWNNKVIRKICLI